MAPPPSGYRDLTCPEAQNYELVIVPLLAPGESCTVIGGTVTRVRPFSVLGTSKAASTMGGTRCSSTTPLYGNTCRIVTSIDLVPLNSVLVKAWPLGRGWVVYVGAGLVPEDKVFAMNTTWSDRDVWRQLLRSLAKIRPLPLPLS